MIPPVFSFLNVAPVNALVDTRIHFIDAGDSPTYPYIRWFVPSGAAGNYLGQPPNVDNDRVQIDCFTRDKQQVLDLADAVQSELDRHGHQLVKIVHTIDPDTKSYRVQFDYSFWTDR